MEKMDKFKYLGVGASENGGMGEKINHRLLERKKLWGSLGRLWNGSRQSINVKMGLYERVMIPTTASKQNVDI